MITRLLATPPDRTALVARVTLGLVIFPHGAQKLFGWFGGFGFDASMHYFTDTLGIPWVFGFLAIMAECLGSVALILGLLSRVAALGVGAVMAVAAVTVFRETGAFFMDWLGQRSGEGIEFHLLAVALAAIVAVRGGGAWSVDRAIARVHSAAAWRSSRLAGA